MHGAPVIGAPAIAAPAAPVAPAAPPADLPKAGAAVNAKATIVVSLPADAKLAIDEFQTTSTSATRVLNTPELAKGGAFAYTLKAQIVREGQTLTAIERVTVTAGEETRVALPLSKFVAESFAAK